MASERGDEQKFIFNDGEQIRAVRAEADEQAWEILEYIHANGYELIAIEDQ